MQPKFLSKAERERIALEKRAKEVEAERRAKIEQGRAANGAGQNGTTPEVRNGDRTNGDSRSAPVPTGPRSLRNDGEIPRGPAAMRNQQPNKDYDLTPPAPPKRIAFGKGDSKGGDKRVSEAEAEAELVRQRYMGANQTSNFSAKKKRKRTTERKFNFEWNAEEDTSSSFGRS